MRHVGKKEVGYAKPEQKISTDKIPWPLQAHHIHSPDYQKSTRSCEGTSLSYMQRRSKTIISNAQIMTTKIERRMDKLHPSSIRQLPRNQCLVPSFFECRFGPWNSLPQSDPAPSTSCVLLRKLGYVQRNRGSVRVSHLKIGEYSKLWLGSVSK